MIDTEKIKEAIDVATLIREYIELKPSGIRLKGLCPFHNEKTPSFMVSAERQSWHCFGCGKGGDIFSFVQDIEGMSFVEALEMLAQKTGVELTKQRPTENKQGKQRLKDIHVEAARFYHGVLTKLDVAAPAREYLQNRGLKNETIEAWQVGFIPDQWDLLTKYLLKKGHGIDDLVLSGLTIKREGVNSSNYKGFYDRFRGRVMFPIRDEHSNVVGFTGRVLVETEKSGGKYVNTPQSPLYDKSRVVFGLDKAKKAIRNADVIVMVEGQMDVIAVWQSGMENVVATSGTALTAEQIKLLSRYSKHVAIAFDEDEAGQKAAKRGIDLAMAAGMHVKIIQIPEGSGADPDDCVSKDPEVWQQAVKDAVDVMPWYVSRAFSGRDISSPKDKQIIADEVMAEISRIPYPIEQDHWIQLLAKKLGTQVDTLRSMLQDGVKKKTPISQPEKSEDSPKLAKKRTRTDILAQQLMSFWLVYPQSLDVEVLKEVELVYTHNEHSALYEAIKTAYTPDELIHLPSLQSGDHDAQVGALLLKGDEEFSGIASGSVKRTAHELKEQLLGSWKKERRTALAKDIAAAEGSGNQQKIEELLQEFQKI